MIGLFNHDGTFFTVESPDVDLKVLMREDVRSLDVTEEMGMMDQGSVTFHDRADYYSRVLRPGLKLDIGWGINLPGGQQLKRNKVKVVVNSPGGSGSAQGEKIYTCAFMALGFRGDRSVVWYEAGTRADVVATVMAKLGVVKQEIDFARGNEPLTAGTKVCQYESDYAFLVRMANEWRCAFRMGLTSDGSIAAAFIDYSKLGGSKFASWVGGGAASVHLEWSGSVVGDRIEYSGKANVLSYTWKDNSADSANGDGTRMVIVDGVPQFYRQVVEGETVKTYRLVPERIEQELGGHDVTTRTSMLMDYLSAKDFAQVKRFFVEDSVSTAPQGSGIVVNASMMGDPTLTAGLVATFGAGFPDRVGAADRTWWVRKAEHKIDASGYFTDLEVADAYSFSPTGELLYPSTS